MGKTTELLTAQHKKLLTTYAKGGKKATYANIAVFMAGNGVSKDMDDRSLLRAMSSFVGAKRMNFGGDTKSETAKEKAVREHKKGKGKPQVVRKASPEGCVSEPQVPYKPRPVVPEKTLDTRLVRKYSILNPKSEYPVTSGLVNIFLVGQDVMVTPDTVDTYTHAINRHIEEIDSAYLKENYPMITHGYFRKHDIHPRITLNSVEAYLRHYHGRTLRYLPDDSLQDITNHLIQRKKHMMDSAPAIKPIPERVEGHTNISGEDLDAKPSLWNRFKHAIGL